MKGKIIECESGSEAEKAVARLGHAAKQIAEEYGYAFTVIIAANPSEKGPAISVGGYGHPPFGRLSWILKAIADADDLYRERTGGTEH